MSRSSKYPEQFRRDAVELVGSSDRPLCQIARELGVNHETLRSWVNAAGAKLGLSARARRTAADRCRVTGTTRHGSAVSTTLTARPITLV
ncbi:transposase [Amycolatopsis coloradensis]|uniref:transposase n=1 Tax=Amycolatopsis coloradensis TaxID=76021 RepID=UPI003CC921D8